MLRVLGLSVAVIALWATLYCYDELIAAAGLKAQFATHEYSVFFWGGGIALIGGLAAWYLANDMTVWSLGATDFTDTNSSRLPITASVDRLMPQYGLRVRPNIVVYAGEDINAVAVARTQKSSTIALSKGLLDRADSRELEVILSYSLAKIRSGHCQVELALQGVVLAFTLFPARMFALLLGTSLRTAEEETPSDTSERLITAALEIILLPFNTLVTRVYCRLAQKALDRQVASLLGAETVAAVLQGLNAEPAPLAFREAFALPHKFGRTTSPRMRWLSYHYDYSERAKLF